MRSTLNKPLDPIALGAVALALLAAPRAAYASDDCPPHAVCDVVDLGQAAPPEAPPDKPAAPPEEPGERPAVPQQRGGGVTVVLPPTPPGGRPQTYVIVPDGKGGHTVIVQPGGYAPAAGQADPAAKPDNPAEEPATKGKGDRRFGLHLRFNALAMPGADDGYGDGRYYDAYWSDTESAGMGGMGFAIRYRPAPAFAMEFSLDGFGGKDANLLTRGEAALAVSALVYPFPDSWFQPYVGLGVHASHAWVESDTPQDNLRDNGGFEDQYNYAGAHATLGVEFRLGDLFGLSLDGLGFVRQRVDPHEVGEAEVNRDDGEPYDTSGGFMGRAGMSFWW